MKVPMAGDLGEFWIVMIGDGYMRPVKRAGDPLPACTRHIENAQKYASRQMAAHVVQNLVLAREKILSIRGGGSAKSSARKPVALLHFVVTNEFVSIRRPVDARPIRKRPVDHLGLNVRTRNALRRAKIHAVGELADLAWIDLFCIKGVGRGAIESIEKALASVGLGLAKTSSRRWNPTAERRCPAAKGPLQKGRRS